jgi:hypothetical protein
MAGLGLTSAAKALVLHPARLAFNGSPLRTGSCRVVRYSKSILVFISTKLVGTGVSISNKKCSRLLTLVESLLRKRRAEADMG